MTIKSVVAAGALLMLSLHPTQASGEDSSDGYQRGSINGTKIVDYSDLDLSSIRGQQQLSHRVAIAVIELCQANTVSTIALYELLGQKRCRKAATSEAEPQIAAAISRAKYGTGLATISGPSAVRLTAK